MSWPYLGGNWHVAENWKAYMENTFWNGIPFSDILFSAIWRLDDDLRNHRVYNEAVAITNANAPMFNSDALIYYLKLGWFKYRKRIPIGNGYTTWPPLMIHGVPGTPAGINGEAPINGWSIHINFPIIVQWAIANPAIIPTNAQGRACLEVYVGKTVIHEIMHNHGATHGTVPPGAYNPAAAYYRSLPEVAEHAFYNIYQGTLFGGAPNALPLHGATDVGGLICRTETESFETRGEAAFLGGGVESVRQSTVALSSLSRRVHYFTDSSFEALSRAAIHLESIGYAILGINTTQSSGRPEYILLVGQTDYPSNCESKEVDTKFLAAIQELDLHYEGAGAFESALVP